MPRKNNRHINHGRKLSKELRQLMRRGPFGQPAGKATAGKTTAANTNITRKKDTDMENLVQDHAAQTAQATQALQPLAAAVKPAFSYQRILGQELRPMRPQGDRDPRIVRGSVWFANLGGRYDGETPTHSQAQSQAQVQIMRPVSVPPPTSVQSGIRPVLVISNDLSNLTSSTITIIPFTGAPKRMDMPTHVAVKAEDVRNGYSPSQIYESTLLCEQVTTIDKYKLVSYVGAVAREELMREVETAVLLQVGIAEKPTEVLSAPSSASITVSSQLEQ